MEKRNPRLIALAGITPALIRLLLEMWNDFSGKRFDGLAIHFPRWRKHEVLDSGGF